MKKTLNYLESKTPFKITNIQWEDPQFHLRGDNCVFNALTEWRLISNRDIIGCYDETSVTALTRLQSLKVVRIESLSQYVFDPVFIFEDGSVLEVFSSTMTNLSWSFYFEKDNILVESNDINLKE